MKPAMKFCPICEEEKEITCFNKNKSRYDGLQSVCKECQKKRDKKYRQENPTQKTLDNIRQRAKKLGVPFDLELSDLNKVTMCPVFNVKLERGARGPTQTSPSVDRIDPKRGYTKDNIQIMSNLANVMKQDATKEQLLQFAEWIFKTYKEQDENNCV